MADLNEAGLKSGLEALARISATLAARSGAAEQRSAEAEADLNACRMLLGFADAQQQEFREKLNAIEAAKKDGGT